MFLSSVKKLFIVDADSVAETDHAEQNPGQEEEKTELESSEESEAEEAAREEKRKKKRVGFRDRKVSPLS